jgi:hypothetical protein
MSSSNDAGQQTQATTRNEFPATEQTPAGISELHSTDHIVTRGTEQASTDFDSGFFENEDSNTPRKDYKDFILFDDTHHPALYTNNFFADADASTKADHGSIYEEKHSGITQIGQDVSYANQRTPPSPRAIFYDAVRDAVQQSVNEAITTALASDYDEQSQYAYSRSPPATPYLRPLELWEHTYERHESIAYRFEQPPYPVREQR